MVQTSLIRFFALGVSLALLVLLTVACGPEPTPTAEPTPLPSGATPPYPPSPVIDSITWHLDTHTTATPGSDIWAVTWAADGNLYSG